jgi:hypothetical protein
MENIKLLTSVKSTSLALSFIVAILFLWVIMIFMNVKNHNE